MATVLLPDAFWDLVEPQAAAMLRAAHGQHRENVAGSQTLPDGLRVIRAVTQSSARLLG